MIHRDVFGQGLHQPRFNLNIQNEYCYKFLRFESKNWFEIRRECEGHVLSLDTYKEAQWIRDITLDNDLWDLNKERTIQMWWLNAHKQIFFEEPNWLDGRSINSTMSHLSLVWFDNENSKNLACSKNSSSVLNYNIDNACYTLYPRENTTSLIYPVNCYKKADTIGAICKTIRHGLFVS